MASRTAKKNTKVAAVEQTKKDEVLFKVKDLTPKTVATKVAELQAALSGELAGVQARLTEQLTLLNTVNQAIGFKKLELEELHGLEASALVQAGLEDQITMTREQWAREKAQRDQIWAEQETLFDKNTEREQREWEYEFEQTAAQAVSLEHVETQV